MKKISKHTRLLLLLIGFIAPYFVYGQHTAAIDSLKGLLTKTTNDTAAGTKLTIALFYESNGQHDSALLFAKQAEHICTVNRYGKELLKTYTALARIYADNKQYLTALDYCNKVIDSAASIKDTLALHSGYMVTGDIYLENNEYKLTIDYYTKALNISLATKSYINAVGEYVMIGNIYGQQGIYAASIQAYLNALNTNLTHVKMESATAVIYVDIANIYQSKNDTTKAMYYYKNSLMGFKKLKEQEKMAIVLGNIGNLYMEVGKYKKAETYIKEYLAQSQLMSSTPNITNAYTNLGELYLKMKQYAKSLKYYYSALQAEVTSGDLLAQTSTLDGLSELYTEVGDNKKAEEAALGGFEIAKKIDMVSEIRRLGKMLSSLYEKKGRPAKALYYYKQYVAAKDTMENSKAAQKMIDAELNYKYQRKQQAQKMEQEKKDALAAEKTQHARTLRNIYLSGLLVVIILAALLLQNFIRVRKANRTITEQKSEVEQQKLIVERKNRDITDSINYAKRIQQAMLPTTQTWNIFFKQSFIYYKPKDIVSGDFYWCMAVGNGIMVAVADCTGHGVPGAFMSMLGISSLNKIVGEKGIKQPDKILDALRDEIIKSLNPEGKAEEVKDGMDMTLCYINAEANTIEYAAANNPLCIIRKNGTEWEMLETSADKMPVGKYVEENTPFSYHRAEIKKGDRIYLFTDGYADQFGGERGKKFKYRRLQNTLLSCQSKNMSEQKLLLEDTMKQWQGNLEQVDDMLIAGIEIA